MRFPESQNLSNLIMRVFSLKVSHWAETKKKQTIKLQLKHWNIGHTGVSPADPPVPRWHTGQLVTMTWWWHDDPHTQNTARGSGHPLHRLPQYSDQFSRQIDISDKCELEMRSKLIQVTMFWFQVIEEEMKQRREQVAKTCSKYGSRLKIPLKLYNKKLRWFIKVEILMFYQHSDWPFRFDLKHGIMYCENYKVRFQVSMSQSWMFYSDRV